MDIYTHTIELNKILQMLSDVASNEKTKSMALSLTPDSDIINVRNEIAKTDEALQLSLKYGSPSFYSFKDVTGSIKRAVSGAKLTLKEILEIKRMLNQIRILMSWYNEAEEAQTELGYLFNNLCPNKYLEDKIENIIIDENEIADTASPKLASIRRKIVQAGIRIRESLDKIIRNQTTAKYLQEGIVTLRDGRYVVPVKCEYKSEINGLVHDTSSSGATYFIEPVSVVEANNEIRVLQGEEQDEIDRIITELSAEIATYADPIIDGFKYSAELNLYFSKASLAIKMNANAPLVTDDGNINLIKARHPLIDKKCVVPVDIAIGESYNTLIITGPNTGGKTVILKTVGLLCSMAMCGLLIPANEGSTVSVFDKILVDIGDKQSIEQSLSTFSSHMNNVIDILKEANSSSLVLLDELGSGTDPAEGAALAISIIQKLRSNGVKLITSTHYQELKMFALETERVENASCEFDIKTLKPTYRLIIGSPGKSNAFAISSKLGLSDDIIKNAQSYINDDNKKFDKIMDKLETAKIEAEINSEQIKRLKADIENEKQELLRQRDQLDKEKEIAIQKARDEAAKIVAKVNSQAMTLIDELDDLRRKKDKSDFSNQVINAKSKAKGTLNKMYLDANPVSENSNAYKLPRPLKKGDTVLLVDINKKGTVLSEPDSYGNVFVQAGIMKTKINISKLRLTEKEKVTYNNTIISTKSASNKLTRVVKSELDIRGCAVDEGLPQMDAFLDNCVLGGLNIVTIIHGKGTGVLKNAVRDHCKRHPHVKSFRRGVYGEGEDGVTVIELK